MRKGTGRRTIAFLLALLIVITCPGETVNAYGTISYKDASAERAGLDVTEADKQDESVSADEKKTENTDVEDESDRTGSEEKASDTETAGTKTTEVTESTKNTETTGSTEATEAIEATETEESEDSADHPAYQAEDLRFLVQSKEDFGDFSLTDGITYDEEHYTLSVIDDDDFDCEYVGDYVIRYRLTAKEAGYEDIEFTRTITIYADEQYMHDGVLIYGHTGDMEMELAEDAEDGIAAYAVSTVNVVGTGVFMDYFKCKSWDWATGTEVMYAENVNGYNRLVYCLESNRATPGGSNVNSGAFSDTLQKQLNYVLYHGARYYGYRCFTEKYQGYNANEDYYITSMAVHMLNAWAGNEPGYIFTNAMVERMSPDGQRLYWKVFDLVNDAMANANYYYNEAMWSNNQVTLNTYNLDEWTYDKKNNAYRVKGYYYPSFGDMYAYTGRNAISCVDQNGKKVGTVRFEHKYIYSAFWIQLTEKEYEALQKTGGKLTAVIQYRGYLRKATRYIYNGIKWKQPTAMLQFDGSERTRNLTVTATIKQNLANVYVQKVEENTNISLSDGFEFDIYEWNKNSKAYTKLGSLTWKKPYYTNDSLKLPITVINQGKFKVVETKADASHKVGWSKEFVATSNNLNIYLTATNEPNPSKVKIIKTGSDTGKALAGAEFTLYKDKDCTDPVKVDGKAVTATSGANGVAETAEFVRTQTSYWVKETKAPDGYKLAEESKQVVVPAGGTGTVRFEDERSQYRVKVVKTCTQDKSYLEGAVYGVYSERSCSSLSLLTKVGPTGTGGVAVSDPIDYNPNVTEIYLKELVAPKYHKLSSTVYTLKVSSAIENGGVVTLDATDEVQTTTVLIHKVDEDGKGLAGAEFTLYKDEACTIEVIKKIGPTNGSGNAESKTFHPTQDTYYLKEIRQPTNYPAQPDKVYKVSVQDGKATAGIEYTVTNTNKIQIVAYKYEVGSGTKKPLRGAEFTIYSDAACKNRIATMEPTNSLGYVKSGTFAYTGPYCYVKETKAPAGYKLSSEVKKVDVSNVVKDGTIPSVAFYDEPYDVTVEVLKVDADDGTTPLEGATFAICTSDTANNGNKVAEGTTGKDGKLTLSFHPTQESYWLIETKHPDGYTGTKEKKQINISDTREGTVVKKFKVTNKKRINTFPLEVNKSIEDENGPLILPEIQFEVCVRDKATGEIRVLKEFWTDTSGHAYVDDIEYIEDVNTEYYLKEIGYKFDEDSPPPPWILDFNKDHCKQWIGRTFSFTPNGIKLVELTIKNAKPTTLESKIRIRKVDDKGNPLKGAIFRIYTDQDCKYLVRETNPTGDDGYTEVTMDYGNNYILRRYYIKEIKYPDGGPWKELTEPKVVDISSGTTEVTIIKNTKEPPSLTIYKYDSETGEPLKGAKFKFSNNNLSLASSPTWETNESGEIKISESDQLFQYLTIGYEFTITEINAPNGYELADPVTVILKAGENRIEIADNPKTYDLQITKEDKTGKKIAGAVFGIYPTEDCKEEDRLALATTDASGIAKVNIPNSDLSEVYRKVWIREEYVPDGYVLDREPRYIQLALERTNTISFVNEPVTGIPIEIYKYAIKTDATQTALSGIHFYLNRTNTTTITEESIDLGTTNSNGYIHKQLENVEPGDYYLVETDAPSIYTNPVNPRKITLKAGNSNHFDVANVQSDSKWHSLKIQKIDVDTGKPLQGVVFEVYADAKCTKLIETLSATDENGYAYSSVYGDDTLSHVWVKERSDTVPYGYKVKNTPLEVSVSSDSSGYIERTIENTPMKKRLRIKKVDSYTGNPLEGAQFTLYADIACTVEIAESMQTGSDGTTEFLDIPVAYEKVYIKETKTPKGYDFDATPREVILTNDTTMQTITWENSRKLTVIKISKITPRLNGISGVNFEVYKDLACTERVTEAGTLTTDTSGNAISSVFPYTQDTYYVKEVSAPDYYAANIGRVFPVKVEVLDDPKNTSKASSIEIMNASSVDKITVIKKEKGTEKPIKGAIFEIYHDKTSTSPQGIIGPTDENGKATAKTTRSVFSTRYYLKEVYVPAPYKLSDEWIEVNVSNSTYSAEVTVYNETEPSKISLTKIDASSGEPLAGAVFGAYLSQQDAENGENKQFEIGPTSASGFAVSKEFTAKASTYYLKEITAPKGYTLSSEIRAVNIVGGEIAEAGTFTNIKETNSAFIEVTKVSAADENKKLAGAVFAIYDNKECSGEPVQIMDPTDANGYSKSKELLVTQDTKFYLKEITTPTGYYQLKDSVEVTAKMKDTTKVTIRNTPIPTTTETAEIKIKKTVTDTTDPLAGAVFGIYTDVQCQNLWMELPATDDNGEAVSPTFELVPSTAYYVKEIYAPAGYELSNEVTTVNVVDGQKEYVVERTNTPKWTQIRVKKYDAESQTLLKGAEFTVYADVDCTTPLDTFTTGSDGIGTSKQLLMDQDVFYVKETEAPSGYTATNAVWKVTAKENAVCATLEVPNAKDTSKLVRVKVKKVESGTKTALQGAYFTVYKDKGCTQPVVEVGPTKANGEAVSVQFIKEQDTYWIKESKAPDGYVLSDQVQQIIPGTDTAKLQAVTFENSRRQIKIRVNKTDAETDEPLAGAHFKVYKSNEDADKQQNEVCEIGPTDKNGQAEATIDYEQDTYYLRESQELAGYVKSDSVDMLVITGDTTDYYATNTPEYTMIGIRKVDAYTGVGLAGAEFNIYSASECTQESFVGVIGPTDENGYAYSGQIRAGSKEFYLKETKAPDGYALPYDDDVYGPVDGNAVGNTKDQISAPFGIENQKIEISFDIEKKDIQTKKLLAGAAFALYKDAECTVKVLDFTSTKAEGVFTSGTFEATQEVYYIKEVTVPQGYQEPDGPTEVNIYKLLGMEESDRKVTIMNVPENTKTIKVAVNKIDAVTAEPVEGAVFAVYEDEKCTKEITRLPKTDQGGYAQSEEFVYTGSQDTYYLKEVGAPKWYHINNTVIPFKVETKTISGKDENGNSTGQTITILYVEPQTIKNEPEMTQIQVKKTDAESGDTLAGAYFKVYKTMADAQKQQNEVCEIGPTGADGIAVSKKFHRMQDEVYYIRESKAPEGYVISDDIQEVTTEAEQISKPVPFTDTKAKTNIQIRKTAVDGTTPLEGAVFELYETAECTGKPLLTLPATGTNGIATSDSFQITQEWYYLKEKTAPAGYEVSTTVIPVKPENGATLTVGPILNGKADDMAEIHILKKEAGSDKVLAGAVYGIYPSKDCIAGTEIGMIGPTDADGKAGSGKFVKKQSSYYLKELQAPEGYECSDTVTEVNLDNGDGTARNPVTLYDTQKKSKIQIYKYQTTTGSPLRGITFTVYTDADCKKPFAEVSSTRNGTLTTGENGYAVSEEFVPTQEIYYIKETAVPQDYSFTLPDTVWEISVTAGETAEIQIANGALAKIYVRKTAKDNPKNTLSGAKFDIYKDFECTMKVGSVGPTDTSGEAVSTSFTKEQDIYYLKETEAPDGYKLRQEPIAVTVTNPDDDSSKINWNDVQDEKLEGSITVKKLDRDERPLQGAGFQLEVYNSGSWSMVVANKETDADGSVKFEHLEPGRYRLTEIKAPQGFNLLNSSREIMIPYEMKVADVTETPTGYTETKGDKIYFYDITLTFYNSLPFNVPVTGGSGNFGAATTGILLMAGTAACALLAEKRRKKKRRAS